MVHPDSHLHFHREREVELHRRVLHQARSDLASDIAESRLDVRRGFLVRLWSGRHAVRPAPAPLKP
jgi:hypothetical protein